MTNGTTEDLSNDDGTWYTCTLREFDPESCLNNYQCDNMRMLLKTLALIGALLNFSLFPLIYFVKRLRKTCFIGFVMLAVPDFIFLILKFLDSEVHDLLKASHEVVIVVFYTLLTTSYICSILHVILLSAQQVIMAVYPRQFKLRLTPKHILLTSLFAWCVCLGLGIMQMSILWKGNNVERERTMKTYSILIFISPITMLGILCVFKTLKRKHERTSDSDNAYQSNSNDIAASRTISMIIIAYVIATTPINMKEIIQVFICFITDPWFFVLHHIGTSLVLVNHAMHSIIFALNATHFRSIHRHCLEIRLKWLGRAFETNMVTERSNDMSLATFRSSTSCR